MHEAATQPYAQLLVGGPFEFLYGTVSLQDLLYLGRALGQVLLRLSVDHLRLEKRANREELVARRLVQECSLRNHGRRQKRKRRILRVVRLLDVIVADDEPPQLTADLTLHRSARPLFCKQERGRTPQ